MEFSSAVLTDAMYPSYTVCMTSSPGVCQLNAVEHSDTRWRQAACLPLPVCWSMSFLPSVQQAQGRHVALRKVIKLLHPPTLCTLAHSKKNKRADGRCHGTKPVCVIGVQETVFTPSCSLFISRFSQKQLAAKPVHNLGCKSLDFAFALMHFSVFTVACMAAHLQVNWKRLLPVQLTAHLKNAVNKRCRFW